MAMAESNELVVQGRTAPTGKPINLFPFAGFAKPAA